MVTTLFLIRHGATAGGRKNAYKGSIDVPLSEEGEEQMKKAAAYLSGTMKTLAREHMTSYLKDVNSGKNEEQGLQDEQAGALSAVYCSDLSRARKSAGYIAGPYGLDPVAVPDLRERHFGIWEGMTFLEIRDRYPAEFEAWAKDPVRHSPPGGESTLDVKDRVIKALDEIMDRHCRGGNDGLNGTLIAVVAHGGVNRIILCHILGVPLENVFRIEQDHAAVNIIEFWERYPVVKLINGGDRG
jgi:broad specificity phosphatase PhoE